MEDLRLRSSRKYDQFALQSLMQRLRTNLRITSSDMDGVLQLCLRSAIEDSEAYIGSIIAVSTFSYTDQVETVSSSPVLSVDLLGPVSPSVSPMVTLAGQIVEGCTLVGRTLRIPVTSRGMLHIVWTAGMPEIPDNVAHAVVLKAAYLFDTPTDSVKERVTVADKLLNPFKRFGR